MNTTVERNFIRRLSDSAERGIAESAVPRTCLPLLKRLEGCACVRRVQGVRGARFIVRDQAVLAQYLADANPLGTDTNLVPPTSRADAVLRFGDAKVASAADCLGVFLRSSKPGITVSSALGTVPVSDLTRIAGGTAIVLTDEIEWQFSGSSVALIENAEAFWHHERVLPQVDMAIWTMGRMPTKRLLGWLASASMQHCQYIHWGDYDPVGVAEYIRLRKACPNRVVMWMPPDLDALLKRHGKRSLLMRRGNARVYGRLRAFTDDATVARLVKLFDTYGVGLEQEICLTLDGPA